MLSKREKNTAFITHLSSFFSFVFPLGSILGPLILWSVNKDRSNYVDENGVEAVNFNISYVLYIVVLSIITFPLGLSTILNNLKYADDYQHNNFSFHFDSDYLFGFLSLSSVIAVLGFIKFFLVIVASIKASKGEAYKYPLTIKFIK